MNLRDRGYGNSMEGLQLKKAPERHTRQKKVVPGEANVSKGGQAMNSPVQNGAAMRLPSPDEIREMPFYGSVPEYSPVYHGGNAMQSTPLNIQYSSEQSASRIRDYENAYRQYTDQQRQLVPAETSSNLSLEELKGRMDVLREAMWDLYRKRDGEKFRVRDMGHRQKGDSPYVGDSPEPWTPAVYYSYEGYEDLPEYTAMKVAINNSKMDAAKINMLQGRDPRYEGEKDYPKNVPEALAYQDYYKSMTAADKLIGDSIFAEEAAQEEGIAKKKAEVYADEDAYAKLFQEYNNLKNEYNVRLAQYLQGLR